MDLAVKKNVSPQGLTAARGRDPIAPVRPQCCAGSETSSFARNRPKILGTRTLDA